MTALVTLRRSRLGECSLSPRSRLPPFVPSFTYRRVPYVPASAPPIQS
jgi:hypothetical protein